MQTFYRMIERQQALFISTLALALITGATVAGGPRDVYRASARLLAPSSAASAPDDDVCCLATAECGEPNPVVQELQNPALLFEARRRAAAPGVRDEVVPTVRVEPVRNTDVVSVTVECRDPEYAARMANAIAELYTERPGSSDEDENAGFADDFASARERLDAAAEALTQVQIRIQDDGIREGCVPWACEAQPEYVEIPSQDAEARPAARILERASVPTRPVRGGSPLGLLLWALGGLGAAAGAAGVKDALDRRREGDRRQEDFPFSDPPLG